MAIPITSISGFQFISLSQPPPLQVGRILATTRPGRDGVQLQKVGTSGAPFAVVSRADAPTIVDAHALYAQYVALQQTHTEAVRVIWGNFDLDAVLTRYHILEVSPIVISKTILGIGGLNSTSRAITVARWTLLPDLIP